MSLLRSLRQQENGQTLIEFALVLPILILVSLAIVDFGKALNYWNDATHITAEGARYAAVNGKPNPASPLTLQAQLLAQADTGELRNGGTDSVETAPQVCITFPNGTAQRGDPVRVSMTFRYAWLPLLDVAATDITSTAVMRLETAPTVYTAGCA